jgi:Flp pilus assembly protein TadG
MLPVYRALHGIARECEGAEVAEAAAVLPIVFMLLLGIFWFGQAFSIYGTITHAARQGARAAIAPTCATCAAGNTPSQNAYTAVQNALTIAKLDPNRLSWPATPPNVVSCSDSAVSVPCDANPANVCVQESIQLSNTGSGGVGPCGIAVSFQYPYQFWLPFTTLNMQKIQLQAEASMRTELK